MEYSMVSNEEYESCRQIAQQILALAAIDNHRSVRDLRAFHVINTLNRIFKPKIIGFYTAPSGFNYRQQDILRSINQQFDYHNLYLHTRKIIRVDDIFTQKVSGFTTFEHNLHSPTLFLNANISNYSRMMFTCLHEFTHMYQADKSKGYVEALAMINEEKIRGNAYLPEMQPIEDEANVVASLLQLPDQSLRYDIKHLSFNQIQQKYSTSGTALFNRLYNYFYYSDRFDEYEANQAARAFAANDHRIIYHVRKRLD